MINRGTFPLKPIIFAIQFEEFKTNTRTDENRISNTPTPNLAY